MSLTSTRYVGGLFVEAVWCLLPELDLLLLLGPEKLDLVATLFDVELLRPRAEDEAAVCELGSLPIEMACGRVVEAEW